MLVDDEAIIRVWFIVAITVVVLACALVFGIGWRPHGADSSLQQQRSYFSSCGKLPVNDRAACFNGYSNLLIKEQALAYCNGHYTGGGAAFNTCVAEIMPLGKTGG